MSDVAVGLFVACGAVMFSLAATWCAWVSATLVKILQGISRETQRLDDEAERIDDLERRVAAAGW